MRTRLLSHAWIAVLVAFRAASAAAPAGGALLDPALPGVQFVTLLDKGDFAAAEAMFDATMKAALPEDKLRATWQGVLQQVGPFQKQLRTRVTDQAGYKIVLVTCQFEKAALDARVVVDTQGRIAGLFFAPTPVDAGTFKTPSYAKADEMVEKEFTVGAGEWVLPGTLTLPKGAKDRVPAVVLVHGSGPNDRDETIGANKPFRDLAWGLAAQGIAVVRYEKRTRHYASKLAGSLAGFTVKQEAVDDALAAAAQLRTTDGIDAKRVFILGHSLGAVVAPRLGEADPQLAGLILMSGTPRPLEDVMAEQIRYLTTLGGALSKDDQAKVDALLAEIAKVKKLTAADAASSALICNAPPSYWLDLRDHDPLAITKTLKMPLLILQGGRDYQATADDFALWKDGLGALPNVTLKLYPDLNHLFQTGKGKSKPAEYDVPGNVDPEVIADIAGWITKRK